MTHIPLSDVDLRKLLPSVPIMTYTELPNRIETIFTTSDVVVLLLEHELNNGHWVCLIRLSNGDIEYYDPLSSLPDQNIVYFPYSASTARNRLGSLLKDYHYRTGHKIHYNAKPVQKMTRNVATCGHHIFMRIKNRHIDVDTYVNLLSQQYDPDEFVAKRVVSLLRNY
jgi:hypothetical protein